jgi:hypothetical protein
MISRILTTFSLIFVSFAGFSQVNCAIKNLKVETSDCNAEQKFKVTISFDYANPGTKGFKIQGNGTIYGTFTTQPVVIDGLPGNCSTPYEFVVKDVEFPECSSSINIGKVCCQTNNASCKVKIINSTQGECNADGKYNLGFDLLHYDDNGLGFDLWVNGAYHSFHKYSELPLKNILVKSSGNDYETILVCENDNNKCCDSLEYVSPCKCNISDIRTQIAECSKEDSTYYYRLNFVHQNTSDSFYVAGVSPVATVHAYNKLPLLVGPIAFGDSLDILVADKNQNLCFQGIETKPVYECVSCNLGDIKYSILPCIGEKIYVKLQFKATNPGVKGFTIRGNGVVYGTNYSYSDGEYYVGPIVPNCEQNYEFVIFDNANEACHTQLNLTEKLCCKSCEISFVGFEPFCTATENGIYLKFNSTAAPSDSFKIAINGNAVGVFKKTTDPLRLVYPFVNGKSYTIEIIAAGDKNCFLKKEITYECGNSLPCAFSDVKYDLSECTADGQFKLILFFKNGGTHSAKFNVKVNAQSFGPFVYGQASYAIGPINKICEGLRLELRDAEDETCKIVIEKELKKCCEDPAPCNINLKAIETVCFDNKVIGLKLLVPGIEGNAYKLYVDGVEIGLQKYANFPVLVNVTPRAEGKFAIKIIDVADPTCFKIFEPTLNCENCVISDIKAKAIECTSETVKFGITFNSINNYGDSVIVVVNGARVGTYSKNIPMVTTPFYPKGITYKVRIFDAKKELCNGLLEFKEFDCASAIDENDIDKIKIYSSNQAVVFDNLESSKKYKLSLFTIDGRMIQNQLVENASSQKMMVNLPSQLVIAKVESGQGIESKLVMIQ